MPRKLDFVVKLGGSAVTKKSEFETCKIEEIQKVAEILSRCWKSNRTFVVVHGAGSFGHHQAREYGVKQGTQTQDSLLDKRKLQLGFCLTRLSVSKLNALIINELVQAGVPAISQPPCGPWTTVNDEVASHSCEQLSQLIEAGYVPVLHGDCVLDKAKHCTILSGDTVCQIVCDFFMPPIMVFVSDVAGLFNKPPHIEGAKLLHHIRISSDGIVGNVSTETDTDHDVTGGIQFKLDSAKNIVTKSNGATNVIVCNASSKSFAYVCSTGDLSIKLDATIISAS